VERSGDILARLASSYVLDLRIPDLAPALASAGVLLAVAVIVPAGRTRCAEGCNGSVAIRVKPFSLALQRSSSAAELGRIGYKSVSSLIPQVLNLSPFRDAPSKQSLPLETPRLSKPFFDKSLGASAKICRTGRLFAIRFARYGEESAVTRKTVSASK